MASSPKIRIFFSSPGDVKMERETARRIVDRLQGEIGDRMVIEPYFWEHEVMVATKDYQENIPEMDGFDIVVCVLWSRLGTPLHPNRHPRPDGGYFESGTEYEFFTAMQAHNQRGTPDIFVFRNSTEPRRPSRPKEAREAVDREVDRLDHFFEHYFQEEQYFTGAVNVYSTLGEFEDKLNLALRSFIEGRFPQNTSPANRRIRYSGLPYLGLSAFDFNDAPVFFGRTAQVGEVVEAFQIQELDAQASNSAGKRFVLILGSSGSGKSSLARAGVLPMLVQPGVIENTHAWRRVIFKPSDAGGDPFTAFATALLAPDALPEFGAAGTTVPELVSLLKVGGTAFDILLRQALAQASLVSRTEEESRLTENIRQFEIANREEDARLLREKLENLSPPQVRIAVLADQLEELFTGGVPDETVSSFIDTLAALATNGRIFILGTLRSDFYPDCLKYPKLVELMRDRGTYALPAPGPQDLGQMIRLPAAAAGLVFEENRATGEKLDELLRDAAIKDPGALPLLSYTLEQLYERRTPDGVMTLATYHDLGGLEGAIGRRAESVFSSVPKEARNAFDEVWKQLVTLSENSEPVRRRTAYGALTASAGAPQLVDALVAARLLTTDQTADGQRIVSVAHEALLKHWPRVVDWIAENLDFLRARSRMATRLAEWQDHNSPDDYLIPPGPPLAEAEGILAKHSAALDPLEIDYIKRSSARARHREQSRLRRARLVATGALVLSALAVTGGVFAWNQSKAADRERVAAVRQKEIAENQTVIADQASRKALAAQTRAAYQLGIESLESGNSRSGLTNLAQSLTLDPSHAGARDRLYSYHLYGLPKAIPIRSVDATPGTRQRISGAKQGPDQRVVYLTKDKAAEVYDLNTHKIIPGPWEKEPDSFACVIAQDGAHIMNVRKDMSSRVWKTATGEMNNPPDKPMKSPADFTQLSSSRDGELFIDCSPDGTARVYTVADGKLVYTWKQEGYLNWFNETYDGCILASSGEELVRFDRAEMKVTVRRKDPEYLIRQVKVAEENDVAVVLRIPREDNDKVANFQFLDTRTLEPLPDTRIIPLASKTTEMWDYAVNRNGSAVGYATSDHVAEIRDRDDATKDRTFRFETYPNKVCFSPDERLFITATPDGTVRIFDADTTKLAFEPISHDGRLEDMDISWDGRYLLTSTANRARIWDLAVGPGLSLPMVQTNGIRSSAFGEKDNHFWVGNAFGVQEWDLKELKSVGTPLHKYEKSTDCLLAANGVTAAMLVDGKTLRFARTDDADSSKAPEWKSPGSIDYWTLSPNGGRFASISGKTVTFVDTTTGRAIGKTWEMPDTSLATSFAKGNEIFAAIIFNPAPNALTNTLRMWSLPESREIPVQMVDALMNDMICSPDGRWLLASASYNGMSSGTFALLWDLQRPEAKPKVIPHPDLIFAMCFSPDSSLFALGGKDESVQVWNTADATPAAKPLASRSGAIKAIAFNKDSRLLGTISWKGETSTVTAWDWREASPVSEKFELPTIAEFIAFTQDGRKMVFYRPAPGDESSRRLLQVVEVSPPPSLGIDLVALTEGVTARRVSKGGLPLACDPAESWDRVRASSPDSWFFQHPASRDVSPDIHAPSQRWMIEEDAVPIDDLLTAMPAVGLARASIAYWDQLRYNKRSAALEKMDPDSDEHHSEAPALDKLHERIATLAEFAYRNATNDAQVCYYLSMRGSAAGEHQNALEMIGKALAITPDDPKFLAQAAVVHRALEDYPSERKALERVKELQPQDFQNRIWLGLNLWYSGNRGPAKAEFEAAVDWPEISPYQKAPILSYLGRKQESLDLYKNLAETLKEQSADKKYTLDSLVYLILGHFQAGENTKAVEWYLQLIKAVPAVNDPEIVEGSNLDADKKEVLKKVLFLTLREHPELAPKASKE